MKQSLMTEELRRDIAELYKMVTGTDITQLGSAKRALDVNIAGQGGTAAAGNQAIIIDPDTTASTIYYGFAAIGSATSGSVWQIMREVISGGVSTFTWADSDDSFDNVWDDRASLSYG